MAKAKDSEEYVDALNRLALLTYLENIDTCFDHSERALTISERLHYKKGIADASNCLGIAYALKNDQYISVTYFNRSLDLYKQLNDTSNQCQVMMNLGITLANDEKQKDAVDYLYKAYSLGKNLRNDSVESLVIYNIIQFDSTLSKTKTDSLIQEGIAIVNRYNDGRTKLLYNEMNAYQLNSSGDLNGAVHLLKKSITESDSLDYNFLSTLFYADIGDMLLPVSKDSAMIFYKTALLNAEKADYITMQIQTARDLYDYYLSKNDIANSNKYAALLMNYYKTNLQQIRQEGISYLDFAVKEKQLEATKQTDANNRKIIIVLIFAALVCLIMLFFAYRAYSAKRSHSKALEALNRSINSKNELLESGNTFKSRLVSILAHDFKQPLGDVQNLIAILRNYSSFTKEELDKVLDSIDSSSQSSLENFDNILEWIRKQLFGFTYEPQTLHLAELLNETIKIFERQISSQHLSIENNVSNDVVVNADKEMLQFINRNLIHNAIKFSRNNSVVSVNAKTKNDNVIIFVKDEGAGMSKEKIASLFNFVNERKYADNKERGAGIALVICKDFIEKMNGTIWAESEIGKGSCFMYSLPA